MTSLCMKCREIHDGAECLSPRDIAERDARRAVVDLLRDVPTSTLTRGKRVGVVSSAQDLIKAGERGQALDLLCQYIDYTNARHLVSLLALETGSTTTRGPQQ